MKPPRGAIVLAGPDTWRIGAWKSGEVVWTDTSISLGADADEISAKLFPVIQHAQLRGRPIVLALPASDCLSATIATAALPRNNRRTAMEYRLEGKLPLAIEEVSSDFVFHNGQALGVCTRLDTIASTLSALSQSGVRVSAVCPIALLGLQSVDFHADHADVIIWQTGALVDVFLLDAEELVEWQSVPAVPDDIRLILASWAMKRGETLRVALRGADDELAQRIKGFTNIQIVSSESASMADAALQSARQVIAGNIEPLVDFQHEERGAASLGQPMKAALTAILFLFLAVFGSILWRANAYSERAATYEQSERDVFHRLFPNEMSPVGVESRLRSYAAALQTPSQSGDSALTTLHEILAHLPAGLQLQLDEVRIDGASASLHGQVGSLGDADTVVGALRADKRLSVDDPQTQQLAEGGVGFTIAARLRGAR